MFHSKNKAIAELAEFGLIKNVSVMAPAPYVDEAYKLFGKRTDICFGMHGTITSEWDGLKIGPLTALKRDGGLVDEKGHFLWACELFKETKPAVENIIAEFDAQLKKLRAVGFNIAYVDTHMLPEFQIPGMFAAVSEWAKKNGLIDHVHYYTLGNMDFWQPASLEKTNARYKNLAEGQWFQVTHPSVESPENDLMYNLKYPKKTKEEKEESGIISEYEYFKSPRTAELFKELGITTVRYDEAEPLPYNVFIKAYQGLAAAKKE
jgi:hypothetical protein